MKSSSTRALEKQDLPHSELAEQLIIADILINQSHSEVIFTRLTPEVFYTSSYKTIYTAALSLYSQEHQIDITTVSDRLIQMNLLESIGGNEGLIAIANQLLPSGDIEQYIVILIDKYLRRSLVEVAYRISNLGYNTFNSVESLFESAEQILFSLTQIKPKLGLISFSEVLLETFLDLEKKVQFGLSSGASTGFFDLDLLTQGFQKSDLIIIAGRPSMGKTAFALNLARNISELQSFPVAIFSLEMSRQQIIYRFLSTESQISNSRLRSGNITSSEWGLVSKAIEYLLTLRIYLDDTPNNSLADMKTKLVRLKATYGDLGLVIIDYLQLISANSNKSNRVQELSLLTRNLKILARELNIPIIVLSQLSRNVESRYNKRPLLSDLRESGCLASSNEIYLPQIDRFVTIGNLLKFTHFLVISKVDRGLQLAFNRVSRIFSTGYKLVYNCSLLGGYSIQLTANHKLLTTMGWASLSKIMSGTLIATTDKYNLPKTLCKCFNLQISRNLHFSSIIEINCVKHLWVYDVWVPNLGNFISNEILVHNSIEQDADVVLMLYRDDYYTPSRSNTNVTEVIIAKQRNGPTGVINLIFDPKIASFTNFILSD